MRKILIFILLFFLMSGCSSDIDPGFLDNDANTSNSVENNDNGTDPDALQLGDERFDGKFVYSLFIDSLDVPGIESMRLTTITYVFDGTNKAESYSKFLNYTYADGWQYTSTPTHFINEIKVDGTKFSIRLWNNAYSEWNEYEYSFEHNGYTLILHNYFDTTGKNMILLKQ